MSATATSSCVEAVLPEYNSRLDAYTLKYKLGSGGFGSVYLAETVLECERAQVALKVVNLDHAAKNQDYISLDSEKKLMDRISTDDEPGHFPHIIEYFEDQHNAYFVIVSKSSHSYSNST